MNEHALVFDCSGDALVGILHVPKDPAEIGIVVVVGGPQYRVGSHRQFVQLARTACRAGYAVLRFDVRGMGDSEGAQRSFEHLDDDVAAAIDALLAHANGVNRVVLWGLCDGASAAWLYQQSRPDPRVVGVCAVNPWVRSPEGLARTHVKHYYFQRFFSAAFWSKLLRGGVGLQALREWSAAVRTAHASKPGPGGGGDFRQRMAEGCACGGPGSTLLVLSENDYTAKEFVDHVERSAAWQAALGKTMARRCDIVGADHTLSQDAARVEVENATLRWLAELGSRSGGVTAGASRATGQSA